MLILAATLLSLAASSQPAPAQPTTPIPTPTPTSTPAPAAPSQSHAKVTLATELAKVAANGPFTIGVHFTLDPHWHIYWNGLNDTGMAPRVTLTLPEGWTAAPVQWPAPTRLVSDIVLDHIYENEVTLLIEVTPVVSEGKPIPEEPQTIRADVSYMICSNVCVMEKASATASVKLVDILPRHAVRSESFKQINAARALIPRPLPQEIHEDPANFDGRTFVPVRTMSEDGKSLSKLGFQVSSARKLAFYPGPECPPLADLIKTGEAQGDRIVLTLEKPGDPASCRLRGVLAVWTGEDPAPAYYEVR